MSDVYGEAGFKSFLATTREGKRLVDELIPDTKAFGFDEKTELEKLRPFLGEPIYQLFHLYWFLPARIVGEVMATKAIQETDYKFWTTLPDVQKILKELLSSTELDELAKTHMKLTYVRDKIELKMLALTSDLISGKTASGEALENSEHLARSIQESRSKMEAKTEPKP